MVIDLIARLSVATAKAEAMLNMASHAGIDLDDLERVRRRLVRHEHEYDRSAEPLKRREVVRLIEADIEILAAGYKKLAAALDRS